MTDPAFVFGGGISLFASGRISIRPEVETMLVRRDGQNYFVTSLAARFAFGGVVAMAANASGGLVARLLEGG